MTEGPALYRHRPTVVRAEHYTYDNLPAVRAFLAQRLPGGYQFSVDDSALSIDTNEGERAVCIEENYMIVEGLPCDVYPVRKDRFDRLYELALATDERVPPRVQYDEEPCDAPCSHGGSCTAAAGHTGDHAAYGFDADTPICTWPQDGAL